MPNNYNISNQNLASNVNNYYNNQVANRYYETQIIESLLKFGTNNEVTENKNFNPPNFNGRAFAQNESVLRDSNTNIEHKQNHNRFGSNTKGFVDSLNEVKFEDFLSKTTNKKDENSMKENAFKSGIFYDPYFMSGKKSEQNQFSYYEANDFEVTSENDTSGEKKSDSEDQEDDIMKKMSDRFDNLF